MDFRALRYLLRLAKNDADREWNRNFYHPLPIRTHAEPSVFF